MNEEREDAKEIVLPISQVLTVKVETKYRAGKTVTLIEGFRGGGIEVLGKQLKNYCATGGTTDNDVIIIQGNHREKVVQWLKKQGYGKVKG